MPEAADAFRALLAGDPENIETLGYLGAAAARSGRPDVASEMVQRLRALRSAPQGGRTLYWRASIAALSGDDDTAVSLVRDWVTTDRRISYVALHSDPNFESLREDPTFLDIVRPRG